MELHILDLVVGDIHQGIIRPGVELINTGGGNETGELTRLDTEIVSNRGETKDELHVHLHF